MKLLKKLIKYNWGGIRKEWVQYKNFAIFYRAIDEVNEVQVIAEPRAIKKFDKNIIAKLESIYEKNYDVTVGDADGVDTEI